MALNGIAYTPINSAGGLEYVLIADLSGITTTVDASNYVTFTSDASVALNTLFKKYIPKLDSGSAIEAATGSVETATFSIEATVSLEFGKNSSLLRNELKTLKGTNLLIVAKDTNGIITCFGSKTTVGTTGRPMILSTGNTTTGVALSDGNLNTITFTGKFPDYSPLVTTAIFATLQ